MTRIPHDSPRRAQAERYGRELRRAMAARGTTLAQVVATGACSRSALGAYRAGRSLPRIMAAHRLGEVLSWERLHTLAIELRRKPCQACGRNFVDDSGSDNRRYCDSRCQDAAAKAVVGVPVTKRASVAERRAVALRRAVDAFCAGCEPGGECQDAGCALRPVSPLLLAPPAAAPGLRLLRRAVLA